MISFIQRIARILINRIKAGHYRKAIVGLILGGVVGFLYYYYVGCSTGSCAITSNPYSSVLFGSAMGFYLLNIPCRNKC
jgi:hypothetical protein